MEPTRKARGCRGPSLPLGRSARDGEHAAIACARSRGIGSSGPGTEEPFRAPPGPAFLAGRCRPGALPTATTTRSCRRRPADERSRTPVASRIQTRRARDRERAPRQPLPPHPWNDDRGGLRIGTAVTSVNASANRAARIYRLSIGREALGALVEDALEGRSLVGGKHPVYPQDRVLLVPSEREVASPMVILRFLVPDPFVTASLEPQRLRPEARSSSGPILIGLRSGEPHEGSQLLPPEQGGGVRRPYPRQPLQRPGHPDHSRAVPQATR
jgi:hypothetical protein